ncbi:uncharacterized protein LOC143037026 [Oratosquilla oratoria]|uniref:uncharacterized protein LOC143037026 n=1 Tax=Oratosquilla oratoria TaxID=337810 RepID=UPI003F75A57A
MTEKRAWPSLSGRWGRNRQDFNYRNIALVSVPDKMLVHLFLAQGRSNLLKFQRPEQSGITPYKSTTGRILAFRALVERQREFQQGFLAAYVDLKKARDAVHRGMVWDLLQSCGIPAWITKNLMAGLYFETENAVKYGGDVSGFTVDSGIRVIDQCHSGASIGNVKVNDLLIADDTAPPAESLEGLVALLSHYTKKRDSLN